tara:strand:- start:13392 stop:15299 length:1908 start_codon:yes stop_codon:yes gene_type:complete
MSRIICQAKGCKNWLKGKQRKYCSEQCNKRSWAQKNRDGAELPTKPINQEFKSDTGNYASIRRGKYYNEFRTLYAETLATGEITTQEVAADLNCTSATVSRMLAAYKIDKGTEIKGENWSQGEEVLELLANFSSFRNKYFATETGEKYETADFHLNWIENIEDSIENGKELLILSPPRHGKTELLIHFAVFQIMKNPNIRIMWVGGNEDIAKNAVASVLDQLDENDRLKEDFCPPGKSFKPDNRSGKNWSQNQFTVGTRTVPGIKSPTMVAVGKGGKILSRDCDLIIADDIEDHQTTMQPGARENTRQWWTTTLSSRKEEHTAVVVIGSRQHSDDLYHHLLSNESFMTIVETAHNITCNLPDHVEEEHQECMLWPGKRTYKWLMSRMQAAETTGGRQIYEMVYYNQAYVEGTQIFTMDMIDQCMRPDLNIGQIPGSLHLVAGLDPASSGYQAAVLWGINAMKGELFLIDIENRQGGGVKHALQIMSDWYQKYDLQHWVIEENGFQTAIRQDDKIKDFVLRGGITMQGHVTGKNKHDPMYGVGSMAGLFEAQKIFLPTGNSESLAKVNSYRQQLLYFDGKPVSTRNKEKTDLVMAAWFPMKVFRRMNKEQLATMGLDYNASYTDFDRTDYNEAPWG